MCIYFTDFRSGKAPILVATDVAARGLGMFFVYISFLCFFCDSNVLVLL